MNKTTKKIIACSVVFALVLSKILLPGIYQYMYHSHEMYIFNQFLQNNIIAKTIFFLPFYLAWGGLYVLAILKKRFFAKKQLLLFLAVTIPVFVLNLFFDVVLIDIAYLIILPMVMGVKVRNSALGTGINGAFLIVSRFAQNPIVLHATKYNEVVGLICHIDLYIVVVIYYLHMTYVKKPSERKGVFPFTK